MNVKIEDRTYINAITTSIPRSFAPTVTAITTAVNIYNSTLAPNAAHRVVASTEIISALRAEADSRAVLKSGEKTATASAAFAGGRGGGQARGHHGHRGHGGNSGKGSAPKSDDDLICFKCSSKGHRAPDCPSKKQYYQRMKGKAEAAASSSGSADSKVKADLKSKDGAKDSSAPAAAAQSASSAHIEEAWSASAVFPAPFEEIVIDCSELAAQDEVHISDTHDHFAGIAESGRRIDIFDSGASHHMTPHLDRLSNFQTTAPHQIRTANSEIFYSNGMGEMLMHLPVENGGRHIRLKGVLYAPAMHATLISLGILDEAGFTWMGHDGLLTVFNKMNDIIARIPRVNNLYRIFYDSASLASPVQLSLFEIHKRLGHINYGYIKAMLRENRLAGIALNPHHSDETECRTCLAAKARRAPIAAVRRSPLAEKFREHFHMDIWGPATVFTIDHCKYCLTIVDDATRWLAMPLMRVKSEAFGKYVVYEARLQTQHGMHVKILQSDRGGEFLSADMDVHLERAGTIRKLTVHNTPEHNGVAERTHLTAFNGVRAVLVGSGLPKWLWGEALAYVVYVYNRTARHALQGKSPFEVRFGHAPDVSNLHEWGSVVYVKVDTNSKFDARGKEARWIGLDHTSNGHRIYWPKEKKISVECNIVFSAGSPRVEGEHDVNIGPTSEIPDAVPPPPKHSRPVPEPEKPPSLEPGEIREPVDPDIVTGKRKREPSAKLRDIASGQAEGALTDITIDNDEECEVLAYSVGAAT
ncbi:hypothetical protein SCP_0800770 [Sparassis crispa]|uniref:Retrovirus-related Pol polyprotein from transposon TNT 1-94 n=1 Tax=Sparassis crispa TaxID=139825 RepID=A0A401GTP8_9APHY|nr:hypothetical protein SCP_0800770 [Sparassis crispa]GBE85560.1 hypothetical protein SCP_0800770 [Sparassis crispa]